jgi:TonB family protein
MNEFALYLFKSACWLTGFTLVYFLFLRNERFFILKRIFLMTGILVSLVFPFISFHYQVEVLAPAAASFDLTEYFVPDSSGIQQEVPGNEFDFRNLLLIVYIAGLIVITAKSLLHLFRILKSISGNNICKKDSAIIIRASEYPSSFSFFNYIFINPSVEESETGEIINHELVHVKQKHWLDLLLAGFIRMLQWANPFAWIYTGFIRLNHEYLADEAALQHTSNPTKYKLALLNQIYRSPVISFTNSFNYSLNKNRFEMMKKIITSPYRKLKVLLIVPVFAIIFYAFAEPEKKYSEQGIDSAEAVDQSAAGNVKGIVLKETGQPFEGVQIAVTGTVIRGTTDASGIFTLTGVPEDSHLVFSYRGYLTQVLKSKFSGSMNIKLSKDPDYPGIRVSSSYQNAIVVIDNVLSEKLYPDAVKDIDVDQVAKMSLLPEKEAVGKYGERGRKGAIEIITRKKAAELGIKVPAQRKSPEDYPTFRGESFAKFGDYLAGKIKYPADAAARGKDGRVTVNYVIQPDGTISKPTVMSASDQSLGEAVVKAINESPRWEPAKNNEIQDPFSTSVTVKFELPDKVTADDTFIVVEQMPDYPGGGTALLEFIRNNLRYPEAARAEKAEGRVIVRFVVNTKGKVEDAVVIKGVHPLLDAEALRVVGLLSGWLPGAQEGKPVNVWYMAPVAFSLTAEATGTSSPEPQGGAPFVQPEQMPQFPGGQQAMLMTIAERMQYPEEAKKQKIQGKVIIRFVVNKEGRVTDAVVLKGVDPLLDVEALRVVNALPDFKPGMQGGKPVDSYLMVPITFTLPDK